MKTQRTSGSGSTALKSTHIAILVTLLAAIGIPLFSSSSASSSKKKMTAAGPKASVQRPNVASLGQSGNAFKRLLGATGMPTRRLALNPTAPLSETIATFAADCTTVRSQFILGETVCAKTDGVDLNFPGGRWVNWLLLDPTVTVVSGGQGQTDITTNPQTFTFTPTVIGNYKATIAETGDISQTPAGFSVVVPALYTYTSDCATPKTLFNLGETACIKVSGLTDFSNRRVQVAQPDGFILASFPITDNSQQFTYTIPNTNTATFGGQTIEHRGNWVFAIADSIDADLKTAIPVQVHKSNLVVDRIADLQVSKVFIDMGDPPFAGSDITFDILVTNQGPDVATNPHLADVTLPNTTFVSFVRNVSLGLNTIPNSNVNSFLARNSFLNPDFIRFALDSGSYSALSKNAFMTSFMPFLADTPLTFNCVSPSAGNAGTTNCTTSGDLAAGETASFTAVYHVSNSVGSNVDLTDNNSATVGSDTADQFASSDTVATSITTTNPNPPSCTVTCPDNITVGTNAVDGQNNAGAIVFFSAAETAGSCGTVTATPASGSFFPVGSTTVNSQVSGGPSCSFTVTVVAEAQPTISCPANQTVPAPSGQSEASVTTGTPTFAGSQATLSSSRSDQRDVSEPYPIGVTTITWTVTDQYGTTKSCTQTITVTSADAPTIICPSNKSFTATSGCSFTATESQIGTPSTTGPSVTVTSDRSDHLALTDPYPSGQTFITWTATNSVGTAACTQTITVSGTDTEAPVLTVPAGITTSTSSCSVLLDDELGVATAEDNCSTSVNVVRTGVPRIPCPIPGNPGRTCESFVFPTGVTVVTYTATDASGNSTSGSQIITVHESPVIQPTISAPASLNINTGPGATVCGTVVGDATLGTATANDNCPGVTVTRSGVPAANLFPVGTTIVTYTATDADGHTAQATQNVTIVDNTPPVVTPPAARTLFTGPGATICGVNVSDLDGTLGTGSATDNCPGVGAVTRSGVPAGNTFPKGVTTLTYSATDAHGNTGTATQTVTVVDNTPPLISCQADIIVDFDAAVGGAVVTYTAPVGTDNCPGASTSQIAGLASGATFPLGTTTNTFRVTDAAGNTAQCSFKVTVALTSIVGVDSVSITGNALVDSYDSSIGYPASKGALGHVLSNGTITIAGSSKVFGNVRSTRAGVTLTGTAQVNGNATAGTTVSKAASAVITGTITNNALAPVIALPAVPACGPPYSPNSGITGTYSYNAGTGDLTLSGINIATLANGNYCFHNVTLTNSAQLKVNGPVVIKLTGTLSTSGATSLPNVTLIPSNMQILSSFSGANGVALGNSSSLQLVIYAPNTNVNITGSAPLFGTVDGKTITLSNSGMIHYDTKLKAIWPALWALLGP